MVENEQYSLSGFMENVALSEAASAVRACNTKKRPRTDMSLQKQIGSDRLREAAKQGELFMLKEALKSERDSLRKLYRELEEERGASMTAANEAMAMITRLQEEKSAVLVEARRYKLAAEERETHNQEAISLLKEALLTKEDELLALQELLSAYKERLILLETEQGQYLEYRGDNDQLLLLEGPNVSFSCMDLNHVSVCYDNNQAYGIGAGLHDDEKRYERRTEGDCRSPHTGSMFGKQGIESTIHEQLMFPSSVHGGVHNQESEKLKHSQEESLDDVSVSIFARVKRLEERFEYLRKNQAVEHQQLNLTCQSDMVILDGLESEERAKTNCEATSSVPYDRKSRYSMEPEGLPAEDFGNSDPQEPEEILKCLSFEKVSRLDVRDEAQEQFCHEYHGGPGLGSKCRENELGVQRVHDERSTSYLEMYDDESEGVHDVYEVQSVVKQSFVHPCSKYNAGQQKFQAESIDAPILGLLKEPDRDQMEVGLAVPSNYAETEACTGIIAKLSIDVSSLDVKEVHANFSDEDVQQLKLRLGALEGERVFMKESIDSLRKENKELRVLQELAQQLRELNIDVRRNEVTGQQGHPPLFTFLKGVLSFGGSQGPTSTKGNRCLLHSCSFSTKPRQGGLHHILDKGSESPKNVCVTRERKVKLNII